MNAERYRISFYFKKKKHLNNSFRARSHLATASPNASQQLATACANLPVARPHPLWSKHNQPSAHTRTQINQLLFCYRRCRAANLSTLSLHTSHCLIHLTHCLSLFLCFRLWKLEIVLAESCTNYCHVYTIYTCIYFLHISILRVIISHLHSTQCIHYNFRLQCTYIQYHSTELRILPPPSFATVHTVRSLRKW